MVLIVPTFPTFHHRCILIMQGHVLLGQLPPHGVGGKDGGELSDLEGLDGVGEGGGQTVPPHYQGYTGGGLR